MEADPANAVLIISSMGAAAEGRRVERGINDKVMQAMNSVSVAMLKQNMETFFSQLHDMLTNGPDQLGAFTIEQVEVCAQITSDGRFALLGSGAGVEIQGGLRFILGRAPR